ncbi:CaiB/BaiF CoA transferase family protein [Nocardia vaccinii]|uniref:CaiB/BaiF CoA transferase family protein n=1 Tax=Nocardia vaccinii TaxID=1822 RepID=UPI00082C96B1|nr:CoA transferase [Nocardia vaccinii]
MSTNGTPQAHESSRTSSPHGPLAAIRVIDLTRVIMGPLATQILADQGADVIVLEAEEGDTNRVMGPGPHPELSGIALNLLRNKRSVGIDLKSPERRSDVEELLRTCDVVVTTMRPGAIERLGLDYESVRAINPDVVYCQAQGFPIDSPRADEPAYDDIIQAATGIPDVMQRVYGVPGLMPTILADKVCGIVIAQAITAALLHRERTGEGQHVEVAMQETMSAFMLAEHGAGAISEPPTAQGGLPGTGYPRLLSPERRPHPSKDGLVHIFPYLPKHYVALFTEAGVPGAEDDPRYADRRATIANSDSLYRDVRTIAGLRTTEEWVAFCRDAGIPATAVPSLQDLVHRLPLAAHPHAGQYRLVPQMSRFSQTPGGLRRPAPLIGENTDEILDELQRPARLDEQIPRGTRS